MTAGHAAERVELRTDDEAIMRELDAAGDLGLDPTRLLGRLNRETGRNTWNPDRLARVLDRCYRAGYVYRQQDRSEVGRRVWLYFLTRPGREALR